jgi:hypothetical protein
MTRASDPEVRAREWRARRGAQREHDRRSREALERVAGANLHSPVLVHPFRMFSPFEGAQTDGPADLSWNPVDPYGPTKGGP